MQITVIVSKNAFDSALAMAESIRRLSDTAGGLGSLLDGALIGWVEEAWEAVRVALDRVYRLGSEAAQSAFQSADQAIDRVLAAAGNRAADVADALRARLAGYVTALVDEMLKQVRPKLAIGEDTFRLTEVQVSQKLVLGGTLKTSLREALALTSSSEFNVDASYRREEG